MREAPKFWIWSAGVGPDRKNGERSFENSALKIVLPNERVYARKFEQLAEVMATSESAVLKIRLFDAVSEISSEGLKSIEKYAFYSCESLKASLFRKAGSDRLPP